MGKDKLRKFAENLTFDNLIQPEFNDIFHRDHPLKGRWAGSFFGAIEHGCGRDSVDLVSGGGARPLALIPFEVWFENITVFSLVSQDQFPGSCVVASTARLCSCRLQSINIGVSTLTLLSVIS